MLRCRTTVSVGTNGKNMSERLMMRPSPVLASRDNRISGMSGNGLPGLPCHGGFGISLSRAPWWCLPALTTIVTGGCMIACGIISPIPLFCKLRKESGWSMEDAPRKQAPTLEQNFKQQLGDSCIQTSTSKVPPAKTADRAAADYKLQKERHRRAFFASPKLLPKLLAPHVFFATRFTTGGFASFDAPSKKRHTLIHASR
ncbi:hypothetical protein FPQ18DRAFT_303572 [Pyronema domesticum]|nr:hypothetical protein FPQ18DRAFT_303572 [Pyronema domesticum]